MKIWPGWRPRGLLVTCWTTSVRFMFPWTCRLTPTACLTPLTLDVCTLQHKAHCCCDSELQKYNWLSRKKHICFCPKGNHSEHKRNLITGQRCPEFLSALPTELHVRSRSLSCQLSHAESVWSRIVFVCKRWGWSLEYSLTAGELCLLLPTRSIPQQPRISRSVTWCIFWTTSQSLQTFFDSKRWNRENVEASDRGAHFLYTYFCYSELWSFKIHWSKTLIRSRQSEVLPYRRFLLWVSRRASALHLESSLCFVFFKYVVGFRSSFLLKAAPHGSGFFAFIFPLP